MPRPKPFSRCIAQREPLLKRTVSAGFHPSKQSVSRLFLRHALLVLGRCRMQIHLRSLKAVCDLQLACGEGREMTASCRPPHQVCMDLGMLALELDHGFQYAQASPGSQCHATSYGNGISLLCFALAASALLSGSTHQVIHS